MFCLLILGHFDSVELTQMPHTLLLPADNQFCVLFLHAGLLRSIHHTPTMRAPAVCAALLLVLAVVATSAADVQPQAETAGHRYKGRCFADMPPSVGLWSLIRQLVCRLQQLSGSSMMTNLTAASCQPGAHHSEAVMRASKPLVSLRSQADTAYKP